MSRLIGVSLTGLGGAPVRSASLRDVGPLGKMRNDIRM